MSTVPSSRSAVPWQSRFLNVLPAVQTHAAIRFRHLRPQCRQEAIEEAIAAACVSYQVLAARGRLHAAHPGTLADYAVKHVRSGRHVGGSQERRRDLLSAVCQRDNGFTVQPLGPSADGSTGWRCLASGGRNTSVPDLAAFWIDFHCWVSLLGGRDRKIVAALASGERPTAVAQRFGISNGRVSQLRRRYEHDWQMFQREAQPMARAG